VSETVVRLACFSRDLLALSWGKDWIERFVQYSFATRKYADQKTAAVGSLSRQFDLARMPAIEVYPKNTSGASSRQFYLAETAAI
jgi:hypothetical protein